MITKEVDFEQAKEVLKFKDPDSFHILPITNPLGLVRWPVLQMHKANPRFFMLDNIATLTLFRASETVIGMQGIASVKEISLRDWRRLYDYAVEEYNCTDANLIYTIYKEADISIVSSLGFKDGSGPYWTNEWKVFLSWKEL